MHLPSHGIRRILCAWTHEVNVLGVMFHLQILNLSDEGPELKRNFGDAFSDRTVYIAEG